MRRLFVSLALLGLIGCGALVPALPSAAPQATASFPPLPVSSPTIGACPVFPLDNVWNTPVDRLPVHPRSAQYINSIGANTSLHADFGAGQWDGGAIGIPFVVVPSNQANVTVDFVDYPEESDPLGGVGQYPIPAAAPIEHGGDHHVLVVKEGECKLYELYDATKLSDTHWTAANGAIFDLRANTLRPAGWTSADAAGLPILPGLARFEEVQAGEIKHALRFTVSETQADYVWPARHKASPFTDLNLPPMGMRFRLKASFDISGYSPRMQVLLRALKTYGMIVADNGSDWYVSGAPNAGWDDDELNATFGGITGSQFEAVDSSSLMVDPDSAHVTASAAPQPAKIANRGAAVQNDVVTYAITLVGTGAAQQFNDSLPAELTYVPSSVAINPASLAAPSFSGGAVQWNGTLPNSQSAVITFQASINTAQRGVVVNTATITIGGTPRSVVARVVVNGLHVWLPLVKQ